MDGYFLCESVRQGTALIQVKDPQLISKLGIEIEYFESFVVKVFQSEVSLSFIRVKPLKFWLLINELFRYHN